MVQRIYSGVGRGVPEYGDSGWRLQPGTYWLSNRRKIPSKIQKEQKVEVIIIKNQIEILIGKVIYKSDFVIGHHQG